MQDEPQPRAKRLLRKGVCIVAPLLLVAATVYAKVIARRRWEGRAAVKGYGDVFKRQAIKESTKLKGATAQWVPFEARTHPDTPTKLWGNVKRPFPTGAWWTNLVVGGPSSSGDGLGTAFATPYTVSVLPDKGVVLGYGAVLATNDSLTLATSPAVWKSNFATASARWRVDSTPSTRGRFHSCVRSMAFRWTEVFAITHRLISTQVAGPDREPQGRT